MFGFFELHIAQHMRPQDTTNDAMRHNAMRRHHETTTQDHNLRYLDIMRHLNTMRHETTTQDVLTLQEQHKMSPQHKTTT